MTYAMPSKTKRWCLTILVGAILILGTLYYLQRIDKWMAYDDEGGYLYAAWRISLGEVPYRDFLTPQLPGFLYPGAAVLALFDYSVRAVRICMAVLTLATACLTFLTARRLWGDAVAVLTLPLLLVQQECFWAARFFRPEAPMLLWGSLGLYLFVLGYPQRNRLLLALSGLALALSMTSKLFGALYAAGIALFFVTVWITKRDWRDLLTSGLWVGIPFAVVIAATTALFLHLSPNFVADVLGHHVRQGSGTPWLQVVRKGLGLYRDFGVSQPVYNLLAALGIYTTLRSNRRLGWLVLCLLPTALSFLLITRGLQARHLSYLVPALAVLASHALVSSWRWATRSRGTLGLAASSIVVAAIVVLALWPHYLQNSWVASWEEHTTEKWVAYIQQNTKPDDVVVSDYPGINFFARRRTTPLAAGISRGAASSGQIQGGALIQEMIEHDAKMVLLNVAQGAHQFVRLQDYDIFKQYIQAHYHLVKREQYDYRLLEVYSAQDIWPGTVLSADLGHQLSLTGYDWLKREAAPGEDLQITLRWQSNAPMQEDYTVSLQLVDESQHKWGLGSKSLVDIDKETYWDQEGLERAVRIPTSQWPVGEATVETFEIPVDLATPPGQYRVLARVHTPGTWTGLPVFGVDGRRTGYDVEVGSATVLAADSQPEPGQLRLAATLDVAMAPDLVAMGHDLPEVEARPGDWLSFSIYWQALASQTQSYYLGLLLRAADGTATAASLPLVRADMPADRWKPGQILRGQYDLLVPAETPNGSYSLVARVMAGETIIGREITLRDIRVQGRQRSFAVPRLEHPLGATLGERVRILGYKVRPPDDSDSDVMVTVHWQAVQRMQIPWTVFVHLLDKDGTIWAQVDTQPLAGSYPTTAWLPDEIVSDSYRLTPKPGMPKGRYHLAIGMYDASTGLRLPISDACQATVIGDRIMLADVDLDGSR